MAPLPFDPLLMERASDRISINCGSSAATLTSLSGREWVGDDVTNPKFSIKGSLSLSSSSVVKGDQTVSVDPVPYNSARFSHSQFTYSLLRLGSPGQKLIRLHFYPSSTESFNDYFTIEAGPFTLLANFSPSINAHALSLTTLVKEFCLLTTHENQPLNIIFTPSQKHSYAFINGLEIFSLPSTLSYFHGGDIGVRVVGQNSVAHIDHTTALETIHRLNVKWDSVPLSSDDGRGIFGMRVTTLKQKINDNYNITWKISVDVGFRYLVRLHFSETGIKMAETSRKDFILLIYHMIATTGAHILREHDERQTSTIWYKNYMVMVQGHKREGKRDFSISVCSKDEIIDGHIPLEGFEVFKLSNHDNSLAGPNPSPPPTALSRDSSTTNNIIVWVLGRRNAIATLAVTIICLLNIIVHFLRQNLESQLSDEDLKPSNRAKRLCRHFYLFEIIVSTLNFNDAYVIGKGGFGKVYKGLIDNEQQIVAIKRLKSDSNQGNHEFWTEIEILSELRHVNLVSLIGYCNNPPEMIIVYEYMPRGTLADHLYKLARKNNNNNNNAFSFLSWKQRLNICIGSGRGLDYLHTGHGIIHRDVKTSNILLDENSVAKVSDFGLAKTASGSELQSIRGTRGYFDPDYCRTHVLTTKSDVYSFGVVLLEVLCGRPAVEPLVDEAERNLSVWARDKINKGDVEQIVDPSLSGEISPNSLRAFVRVAERCLHDEPKKRPAMANVVIRLQFALKQQENAESLVSSDDITSVADFFPSNNELMAPHNNNILENIASNSNNTFAESYELMPTPDLRVFSFKELKDATRNFDRDLYFGEGGFGIVYKGCIDEKPESKSGSGSVIAVKRWNSEGYQGRDEWQSEVKILGKLSHRNLVKLLGYCSEDKELLLVYECLHKGSLEKHLFPRGSDDEALTWDIRLQILNGAARGLAFLHSLESQVIFRDFKTSNILLDESYNPKLSDFGMAKPGPIGDYTHVSTRVMGTFGYAAPEYLATGHLSVKSDVYGFGVVLLEMLTGLRAVDRTRPSGQYRLVNWIRPYLLKMNKLKRVIDSRLEGRYPTKSAAIIARLARNCLKNEPKRRPSMQEIVEVLETIDKPVETGEDLFEGPGLLNFSVLTKRKGYIQIR